MGKDITRNTPLPGRPALTVAEQRGLLRSRSSKFALQDVFKYGYRNKEDISNLPPNTLVLGSQNMLTNAADLVTIRNGYQLDGPAGNQNTYGVDSSFTFQNRSSNTLNLRKWGTALEARYVNPVDSSISWVNIINTLKVANVVNFTTYWDQNTELKTFCLFVNGDNNLYQWSGGLASVASSTAPVAGTLATVAINNAGTLYLPGDVLTIAGGTGGTITVTSVGVGGTVTGITLKTPGSGYSNATGATSTGGNGSGATFNTTVQTAGTITISGTKTVSQVGFYDNAADSSIFKLLDAAGNVYTYTGVSDNTFFGVTPDASGLAVGAAIVQQPHSYTASQVTGLPTTFTFDLIAVLDNQIWYGDKSNNTIYVSKTNNFLNVSFSSPRIPAEGALITLDAAPISFISEADQMYIGAGRDQWWLSQKTSTTISVSSVAITYETLYASRLKTANNQAPQSQGLVGSFKNSVLFVSNEQIINALGLVKDVFTEPQFVNLSDPIKYDIDAYDFSGGDIEYDDYFIYVALPKEGVVRMYNVQKNYWETPQTIPISCFYHPNQVINEPIFGHSSLTNESYQLFTGRDDNGQPINAVAAFPYLSSQGGAPPQKKSFNELYTEGYLAPNTDLMVTINYDFGGFSGTYTTLIQGSDTTILFNTITDGSLGRNSLGSQPVGTILNLPSTPAFPKFRVINTMPRVDFYEYQIVYSTQDIDASFTLLRFGPAISGASAMPNEITQ